MIRTSGASTASVHFDLRQVAEGAWAAIGIVGRGAYSNAGIIDLGDQTLIFDAFMTPQAADDLRATAERLTGRPATYLVISHAHSDHWCGSQVFALQTPIISSRMTRELMPEAVAWLEQLKEDPSELERGIEEDRRRLETETDPRRCADLKTSISRLQHVLAALPTLEFRFPNQTFDGKLVFYGTRRVAELVTVARAHTSGDAYLILPEERIVFMGDLGFFRCQPYMADCDPGAWKAQLEGMEQSAFLTFMPGHGPLGTKDDLALQRQYIGVVEDLVARVARGGGSVEEALAQPLPAPFDTWREGGVARWEANVRSQHERLAG